MSIIKELKRRNVIKVAIAYGIAAWLLIQIVATTFPVFQLPAWSVTFVTALILIGFPLALIFAWAFELTPEGIKLDKDVERSESVKNLTGRKLDFIIIAVLAVAVIYLAYDEFNLDSSDEETIATEDIAAIEWNASIAVLPFVNMSDDSANEYFSDGLAEEILNLLARIPNLKVIGRTSSFAFKNSDEDLRVIGETLGVKTLLEGSVRKSGNRVRITAQLIDTADGSRIWSESYDRTMTDIFVVQDSVAAAIMEALQMGGGMLPTRGRPTETIEAYTLFLKAKNSLNRQDGGTAIIFLRGAIDLDPKFAEAVELLAYAYWQQAGSNISATEGQRLSHETAAEAVALDPDLAFAQALYRATDDYSQPGVTGVDALELAWRKRPGNTMPLRPLIFGLGLAGYHDEARRFSAQYVELDPLSSVAHYCLGETLYSSGNSAAALAPLMTALDLNSEFAKWFVPFVHIVENRDASAIAFIKDDLLADGISDSSWVGELMTGARNPDAGSDYLDRRIPEILATLPDVAQGKWRMNLMTWYLLFGHTDRYYEIIFDAGPNSKVWTDADIYLWQGTIFRHGGFTAHPRYLEIAELIGLTTIWEKRGPPDFCSKVADEWRCD